VNTTKQSKTPNEDHSGGAANRIQFGYGGRRMKGTTKKTGEGRIVHNSVHREGKWRQTIREEGNVATEQGFNA